MKSNLILIVLLRLALPVALRAVELYVAKNGEDAGSGTGEKPLRTIQAAVDRMRAGDVCLIRSGTYREAVTIKTSGAPGQPLLLQAAPGETVVFDGTETVTGKWEKYRGNIYKIKEPKGDHRNVAARLVNGG